MHTFGNSYNLYYFTFCRKTKHTRCTL